MSKNPLQFFIGFITWLISLTLSAQELPLYSQFTLNPFQFNPSFAGSNGYAEANVFYRKQWIAIENAPELIAFNIQAPVGKNVSLGAMVQSQKTILLTTNLAAATFGYKVRFTPYHQLNFGISAGLAMTNFDLEAIANSNDPALANVVQKSKSLAGQFGINYQHKNLTIGFALPNLIDSKANATSDFQSVNFNPVNDKFGSVSYRIHAGNFLLEPTVLYRALDSRQDQWEGMLMATYKGLLWVGASYRDGYGITGLIGIRFKNRIRVGYAYEYPTNKDLSKASQGSHEIYLGARLGKRNRDEEILAQQLKRDSVRLASRDQKEVEAVEEKEKEIEVQIVEEEQVAAVTKEEPAPVVEQVQNLPEAVQPVQPTLEEKPVVAADKPAVAEATPPQTIEEVAKKGPDGYYLVVGVYQQAENANRNFRYLEKAGHHPGMLFVPSKGFFYVYLFHSLDRAEVRTAWQKITANNKFFGAWIYTPQP